MKAGSKVKFLGSTDTQVKWGDNDDPSKVLKKGEIYILKDVEVHNWHTKVYLEGIKGKFNSVSFKEVKK